MTKETLYRISLSSVTLSEVIQLYQERLKDAIALLYSPQSCYFAKFEPSGASHFCKSITQSNDNPRVSAPLKKANVQNWDAPEPSAELIIPNSKDPKQEIKLNLDYKKTCIFEARIFNEDYELRWLNDYEGRGKAVLLSKTPLSNDLELEKKLSLSLEQLNQSSEKLDFIDTISQEYLIWGEKIDDKSLDNWVTVSTARIGSLNIPFNKDLDKNKRIYLKTLEYFKEVDECGNVSVIEERLVKLEVQ